MYVCYMTYMILRKYYIYTLLQGIQQDCITETNSNKMPMLYAKYISIATDASFQCTNKHIVDLDASLFDKMARLKEILLTNNKIRKIRPFVFGPLINLTYLDLSNNRITYIDDSAFLNCTLLKTLIVNNNLLKVIDISLPRLSKLTTLNAVGNPISTLYEKEFSAYVTDMKTTLEMTLKGVDCGCLAWLAASRTHGVSISGTCSDGNSVTCQSNRRRCKVPGGRDSSDCEAGYEFIILRLSFM